jgi:bacteriocin biosynthesis cyclodehydratase domain-containing protein
MDDTMAKPWLKPSYRIANGDDTVMLENADRVVVLEGRAVSDGFIARLLPLLDGTRDLDELAVTLNEERARVARVIELLDSEDAVTQGPRLALSLPKEARAAAYALAALPAVAQSPREISDALAQSRVCFIGSNPTRSIIERHLADAGAEIDQISSLANLEELAGSDLVVVAANDDEMEFVGEMNAFALEASLTWLPVTPFDGRSIAIGPLMIAEQTCCWECVRLRRVPDIASIQHFLHPKRRVEALSCGSAFSDLAGAITSVLALRWLGYRDPQLPGIQMTIEMFPTITIHQDEVFRVPRCEGCSDLCNRPAPVPWTDATA